MKLKLIPAVLFAAVFHLHAQTVPTGSNQDTEPVVAQNQAGTYILKDIVVDGTKKYSAAQILRFTGLSKGEQIEIPGMRVSNAIKKLWENNTFSEVEVYVQNVEGQNIILRFSLQDLKELGEVKFTGKGIGKSKQEKIVKDNDLKPGTKITQNLISNLETKLPQEYINKGFNDARVTIKNTPSATDPSVMNWTIDIDKGRRIRIDHIEFEGNDNVSDAKLRNKAFKFTKQKRFTPGSILKPSKFVPEKYEEDKQNLINYYNSLGYRDARIISDSVWRPENKNFQIDVKLQEGKKYYIGDITFVGNTAFNTEYLERVLGYKKGDTYDAVGFNKKVGADGGKDDDSDIKSVYMNSGYLFSNVTPIEKSVRGDSIDLEIRITEGEKATWNRVTWNGNTTTHDHVVLRALRTKPGSLFTKSAIKRTYYDLASMTYFEPSQIKYDIQPSPQNNTVDVHWTLAEKGSSQVQLQAGYGGGRFIGTLGLTFNNFSLRNFLRFKDFRPIPQGDGQMLSIQAQAGQSFQNYSLQFTEPWIFGTRPTALSVGFNQSLVRYDMVTEVQRLNIFSANVGLNRLLRWPDDYFSMYTGLQYQHYEFDNFPFQFGPTRVTNGSANNLALNLGLSRKSAGIDPFFPTSGSDLELSVKLTPPYSLFDKKDYANLPAEEKYKWMEFYKVKMRGDFYREIVGKLVLRTTAEMGFMNGYNKELGAPPFERFYMGGTGLFGGRYDGRELIPLRGYENASPDGGSMSDVSQFGGSTIYNRYALELRYPVSMTQTAKIWVQSFVEGGNTWNSWSTFNPFQLKRSAGDGIRVYMGMFVLLGFDFANGFDKTLYSPEPSGWKTHFLMNQPL